MKIAVIQASSQAEKNELIYSTVKKYASGCDVINFGCTKDETIKYSYIEISVLVGLLLASGAVDFVVTGCSSGQGMMLACNNMPGVLCGYIPTPQDAYLFAQINDGNAVQGYPKSEAARKLQDTKLLKSIRKSSQVTMADLIKSLEKPLLDKVLSKKDVIGFILNNGNDEELSLLIKR